MSDHQKVEFLLCIGALIGFVWLVYIVFWVIVAKVILRSATKTIRKAWDDQKK